MWSKIKHFSIWSCLIIKVLNNLGLPASYLLTNKTKKGLNVVFGLKIFR